MKDVKKSTRKFVKEKFLHNLKCLIKSGKTPIKISEELKISRQKVNYYIRQLKESGELKKIGYGVWEVKDVKKSTKDPLEKEVRGHAWIWKIKLPKIKNWNNRIYILDKLKIPYKLIGIKKLPRIIIKDRKVWLCNNSLVIYDINSFIGTNALESRKLAVWGLKEVLGALENKLKVNIKINGSYEFKVSREHYALMKNNLAIQCNKDKEKIYVYDKEGLWFCIDNSYNLDEAETLNNNAMINNLGVQGHFNSQKRTGFKVTAEFILDCFAKLQSAQIESNRQLLIYRKENKGHLELLRKWKKEADLRISKLSKKNIRENNLDQKRIGDFR